MQPGVCSPFVTPLLAVVPARGGSRGIPRKVLQQVGGVPLLLRTLRTVRASNVSEYIAVSTDDEEIAALTRLWGFEVIMRPPNLATDETPLSAVAEHAARALNWKENVGLFQPTCPLLTPVTVMVAVQMFDNVDADWAITAAKDPHLFWQSGACIVPRANRQVLVRDEACLLRESGAVQLFSHAGLFGIDHEIRKILLPIPPEESLDIDTWEDLSLARQAVQRRNILFRIVVGEQVGSGHLFRAIRLAEALHPHRCGISIENLDAPTWALEMLDQRGLWWEGCESSFMEQADMVILDTLDTTMAQCSEWKRSGVTVVSFEDCGAGLSWADLVVNELMPSNDEREYRLLAGPRYAVLRNEFAAAPKWAPQRNRVLVTFGGTDPARLNARVTQALAGYDLRVMLGPGCDPTGVKGNIVKDGSMAEEMHRAALVITGRGRTQYEAAAMGAPALLIAANERESRHTVCPGHYNLGLHVVVSDGLICEAVHRLFSGDTLLAEMSATARAAVDGRGVDRIVRRLEGLLEEGS